MQIVRTFDDKMDTAFVRKGVGFDRQRGRILIKDAGTYFIYSHLVFKGPWVDSESSNSDNFLKLFQMRVKRQNTGILDTGEQLLFEDLQAMRWVDMYYFQKLWKVSTTCSILGLNAWEKLQDVNCSNVNLHLEIKIIGRQKLIQLPLF